MNNEGPKLKSQLEFSWERLKNPDRNHKKGGRSFYFFDLDDNVLHVPTTISLYHHVTGDEHKMSTKEFAECGSQIGKCGPYKDYVVKGETSFHRFRDTTHARPFVEDLMAMLWNPESDWKGPSWDFFYHAVFNHRPVTIITARGHDPLTIRRGLGLLVNTGFLPHEPNYLGIYPVSHAGTLEKLGDPQKKLSVAELKRIAIHQSVDKAMKDYGANPFHRFGMSDDDPKNIELSIAAFREMKRVYPNNRFYVFNSCHRPLTRKEITLEDCDTETGVNEEQLDLI